MASRRSVRSPRPRRALHDAARSGERRARGLARGSPRRVPGGGGRIGLRQEPALPRLPGAARGGRRGRGLGALRWAGTAGARRRAAACRARHAARHGVPGPDERADAAPHHRPPARRGRARPRPARCHGGAGPQPRGAAVGRHARSRGATAPVPARAVGRPAPARRHRHGAHDAPGRCWWRTSRPRHSTSPCRRR